MTLRRYGKVPRPRTLAPLASGQFGFQYGGDEVDLTRTEFDLLLLLVANTGRAFSRDSLLERVWGHAHDGGGRIVDSHVARLRRTLGMLGDPIVTVWAVGDRFVDRAA